MKVKDYIIIGLIFAVVLLLLRKDAPAIHYTIENEIQVQRDKIIKEYEENIDSSRKYVESLSADSSFSIVDKWLNSRIDGTRFTIPTYRHSN